MRRANLACGALLLLLGAVALIEAARMKDGWLGARLMPAVVGVVLVGLGVAHVLRPVVKEQAWPDAAAWRRLVAAFGALVGYVVLLPWIGFLPMTAVFVLALVRTLGTYSWIAAAALTVVISIASQVIFVRWLGMPIE